MARVKCSAGVRLVFWGIVLLSVFSGQKLFAHCDTLDGPVVQTARTALAKGDVTPLLKWVRADDEPEIRAAFQKTLAVRVKGPEAKELADMYLFETLVRIHRAGEGAPYTGLKPAESVEPAVALADRALENGSEDKLIDVLTKALAQGVRKRFQHASQTRKQADNSVSAGREFVEAYVIFTHYVEGLHAAVQGGEGDHGEEANGHSKHDH